MPDSENAGSRVRNRAIATPHYLATEAGEAAFRAGGNAIDAALAAAAVLTVVYPNNTAIGSDLVALVRRPDGTVQCVNSSGFAPIGQDPGRLRAVHGDRLPLRGVDTITVPGGVKGWEALVSLGARLGWSTLFEPAIRHAADGVPLARSVADALVENRDDLLADPGLRELFFARGAPLAEGETLIQPALARSLSELQAHGAATLYGGELGSRLITGLSQLGCVMTLDDLAAFEPEFVTPISTRFRDFDVLTSPPNTQGFVLLRALSALQRLGDPDNILEEQSGALARIFESSNAIRNLLLADPRFSGIGNDQLLYDELDQDAHAVTGPTRATGDTVGVSAIDSDGYAVSLIQSVYYGFGSAILEPTTGILLQDRGTSFSLDPDSPNVIAPRKRPKTTLMPVLVTRDDEVQWVSSAMGGQGQPQIHAQILLRSMSGASAANATSSPRWVIGVQDDGDTDETTYVEEDNSTRSIRSLTESGVAIKLVPPRNEIVGHATLIRVRPDGSFDAASDPRSDGTASEVTTPLS